MIGIIATLRIKNGQATHFDSIFTQMADAVRRKQDGNMVFQLTRGGTEANTYISLEVYRDDDGLQAHRASDHSKSFGAQLGSTRAGRPELEYLDAIV